MNQQSDNLPTQHRHENDAVLWAMIELRQQETKKRLSTGLLKFGLRAAGENRLARQHVLHDTLNRVGFNHTKEALTRLGLSRGDFAAS